MTSGSDLLLRGGATEAFTDLTGTACAQHVLHSASMSIVKYLPFLPSWGQIIQLFHRLNDWAEIFTGRDSSGGPTGAHAEAKRDLQRLFRLTRRSIITTNGAHD
jgi:hypothetical protein